MSSATIGQKINNAQRRVSSTNIRHSTLDLEYLIRFIKARKTEKPDLTIQEIISEIESSYRKIAITRCSETATRSDFCMLRALNYIQSHPSEIWDFFDISDRSKLIQRKTSFSYSPNLRQSLQELLTDACSIAFINTDFPTQIKFVKGDFDNKERENLQAKISTQLNTYKPQKEKTIKDSYVSFITEIAQFLDAQGCFAKNAEIYNSRMNMLGLDQIQETAPEKKGKSTTVDHMSCWKDPHIVKKLPLETLMMACAFFSNRLCKEYIAFAKSVFLISELNFSDDDLLRTNNISPKTLSPALTKYEFLQEEARKQYTRLYQQHINVPTSSTTIVVSDYEFDFAPQDYEDYCKTFSAILPDCTNDLDTDLGTFMGLNNALEFLYQRKDIALDSLILFLLDNGKNVNWGYIEERTASGNSIERKKSMVLLGFDSAKFNAPIRLHKSLHELKSLIVQSTGSDMLPVYAGDEDWFVKDTSNTPINITTPVFKMFTKKDRKHLKEQAPTISDQDRLHGFISHLNWLANGVTPQRYQKRRIVHLSSGIVKEPNTNYLEI